MQNLPNEAGPKRPGPPNVSLAALAQPKVVLLAAGLLGLAVDLFVRPLSWVGLALIVLATMPWLLQAWSLRAAPAAKGTAAVEPANPARAPIRARADRLSDAAHCRASHCPLDRRNPLALKLFCCGQNQE